MVDAAGLKTVPCAGVLKTHANFMVNVGHARAADVLALIRSSSRSPPRGVLWVEFQWSVRPDA